MSYIINKTDGSVLTEVVDGTVDTSATDISLVGKNSSSYGEILNENLVHMLENFANTSQPNHPIKGQLWFDTSDNRLKVYDGNGFKVSGGTIVQATAPDNPVQGDMWIDSKREQLYFYDGVQWILAGPQFTADQGTSGFQITTLLDTLNKSHTVALLYVGGSILGVFAKESFKLLNSLPGYSRTAVVTASQDNNVLTVTAVGSGSSFITSGMFLSGANIAVGTYIVGFGTGTGGVGTYIVNNSKTVASGTVTGEDRQVYAGFNISGVGDLIFNAPVSTASYLKAPNGALKTTDDFIIKDVDNVYNGIQTILNDKPLVLGSGATNEVRVTSNNFDIVANYPDQSYNFKVLTTTGLKGLTLYNPGTYTILTTAALGTGSYATLSFVEQSIPPFSVGDTITVAGMTPLGYNGIYTVTDCTTTGVTFASATTGAQTVPGSISKHILPRVGILTDTPAATLEVNGDTLIQGNLTVQGTSTTINSTTLTIDDKNIELASTANPTDALADSAGIIVKGTTDKYIKWKYSSNVPSQHWDSSESINIASGKTYKIDESIVLSSTTLGSSVVSSSLTSVGNLTNLTAGNITINSNTIAAISGNLVLAPSGLASVDVSGKRITSVSLPSASTDATPKGYVDNFVRTRSLGMVISMNDAAGNQLSDSQVLALINEIYPTISTAGADGFDQNTTLRVHCEYTTVNYNSIPFTIDTAGSNPNITISRIAVDKNVSSHVDSSNQVVIENIVKSNNINAGYGTVAVTRRIRIYKINNSLVWELQSDNVSAV